MDGGIRVPYPPRYTQPKMSGSAYFARGGVQDRDRARGQVPPGHYSQVDYGRSARSGGHSSRTRLPSSQDEWTPTAPKEPANCSSATLVNARYHLDGAASADHPNEDRSFAFDGGNFKVFAVFDGHDGPRAAGFASNFLMGLFSSPSWKSVAETGGDVIAHALEKFFLMTEEEFFKGIQPFIDERQDLQAVIPPGMKSYQAYQLYPVQVARIQELEPKIAGGCTAAVAVVCGNKLYVANVGDSRVVAVRQSSNGTLQEIQLSVDHNTQNEDELKRLEKLGLNPKELIKAGRLGSQENTRSLGDYSIKGGYRDVDVLSRARGPPGTAAPHIVSYDIDSSFRFLFVMSDGVYNSISATFSDPSVIEPNKVLVGMFTGILKKTQKFETASDELLDRIKRIHEDTYHNSAEKDPRSPLAVSCRKRDDMTLLAYDFTEQVV